ncbi:UNVERIFIED_CONTAM: hypothetical protein K2H54_019931 [Gekko kuhli]
MAALKTPGQAGQRAGEEGGGALDRSLQHMLRAIVEERHRLALGHGIGGLVNSAWVTLSEELVECLVWLGSIGEMAWHGKPYSAIFKGAG